MAVVSSVGCWTEGVLSSLSWLEASLSCMPRGSCAVCVSHVQLSATPWTAARPAPLFMEFSRQEHWSGLPFPSPGDLTNPGIELLSLVSPALAGVFFTTVPLCAAWTYQSGRTQKARESDRIEAMCFYNLTLEMIPSLSLYSTSRPLLYPFHA